MVYIKMLKILCVFTVGVQDWNMNKAPLRKLLSLLKKKKIASVGTDQTDQNWKVLSDLPHLHCSDKAESGFDYVQILGDNRPQFRSPDRTWEN